MATSTLDSIGNYLCIFATIQEGAELLASQVDRKGVHAWDWRQTVEAPERGHELLRRRSGLSMVGI
jgi:hypothetical protein